MLLFPAQVKVPASGLVPAAGIASPPTQETGKMATKSNSNVAFSTAGAATLTATVCVYLTSAHARIYAIPLGVAALVALVGLTTWNLSRGGSAALGIFTLHGSKTTARRRTPRPAAPPRQPASPGGSGHPPAPAAAQPGKPRRRSSHRDRPHPPRGGHRMRPHTGFQPAGQPARPRTRTGRQPSQQAPRPSSTPTTRPSTTGNGRRRGHSPASRPRWAAPLTASGPTATAAPSGTRSQASRLAELPCWSAFARRKAGASSRPTASVTSSGAGS